MDLMGNPPQGGDIPLLDIGEQLTTKAVNAARRRRMLAQRVEVLSVPVLSLSSLFNAVFGNHLQPVLNHTFQCLLRVGNAIECLFPAGSWRSWCRQPVCKKSVFRVF